MKEDLPDVFKTCGLKGLCVSTIKNWVKCFLVQGILVVKGLTPSPSFIPCISVIVKGHDPWYESNSLFYYSF